MRSDAEDLATRMFSSFTRSPRIECGSIMFTVMLVWLPDSERPRIGCTCAFERV